ncbi:endolytic transglycosylase MltG [Facklamia sp. P12937]|uniref:endolytic transglycosylase MltG n=1 Tax=Facklamia sp. P12937 TaxID=3421949 RepID=UPI003D169DEA
MKIDWNRIQEDAKVNETMHVKELLWTNRVIKIILWIFLIIIVVGTLFIYWKLDKDLGPVDANSSEAIEVTIPIGSTSSDIAQILEDEKLVNNSQIFNLFMKFKGASDFQAGYYQLKPNMNAEELIATLKEGGEPIQEDIDTTLTVVEGMQITDIAQVVAEQTPIEADTFIDRVQSEELFEDLLRRFPSLIQPLSEIEGLKYRLEGYLFPATYDYIAGMTVDDLIINMVGKANIEFQKLQEDLSNTWLNYHQLLSLASVVEREASTDEDRALVAGVFFNRLNIEMALQSDITVIYALGKHKELVTYEDLEVDSPYNTYQHSGLPVGPINSPSLSSIMATIYPTYSDNYYFVADMNTGKIYYSATEAEHSALVEQYVQPFFDEAKKEASQENAELEEE